MRAFEVAETLLSHHISGAPIVNANGELVGIVSEVDLMRRPETGTTRRPSWWLALLSSERASAAEFIKSHSRKIADVMTREVISAAPDTALGDIAALLERNRIMPILDGGKLVGISLVTSHAGVPAAAPSRNEVNFEPVCRDCAKADPQFRGSALFPPES